MCASWALLDAGDVAYPVLNVHIAERRRLLSFLHGRAQLIAGCCVCDVSAPDAADLGLISHARKNIRHQLVELEEKRVVWQKLVGSSEPNCEHVFRSSCASRMNNALGLELPAGTTARWHSKTLLQT